MDEKASPWEGHLYMHTQRIYTEAFSPMGKSLSVRANLGHAIERAKIEADKLCKATSKRNFAKRQGKRKRIQSARIQAHLNNSNMKPFTRFVVTEKDGKQYAHTVKTKQRFNPSREELAMRKAKGLVAFMTLSK